MYSYYEGKRERHKADTFTDEHRPNEAIIQTLQRYGSRRMQVNNNITYILLTQHLNTTCSAKRTTKQKPICPNTTAQFVSVTKGL